MEVIQILRSAIHLEILSCANVNAEGGFIETLTLSLKKAPLHQSPIAEAGKGSVSKSVDKRIIFII